MNVELMRWQLALVRDHKLSVVQRLIAITILSHTNFISRQCNPGTSMIADEIGVTDRGVRLAIAALIKRGWLRTDSRAGGRGVKTDFQLAFPQPADGKKPGTGVPGFQTKTRNPHVETRNGHDTKPGTAVHPHSIRRGTREENKKENKSPSATPRASDLFGEAQPPPQPKPSAKPRLFDRFWAVYPRKDDPRIAAIKFAEAVKRGVDPEVMIAGAARYAAERAADPKPDAKQFTRKAHTWIEADAWLNAPPQYGDHKVLEVTPEGRVLNPGRESGII